MPIILILNFQEIPVSDGLASGTAGGGRGITHGALMITR